jgi:hypothetical protein
MEKHTREMRSHMSHKHTRLIIIDYGSPDNRTERNGSLRSEFINGPHFKLSFPSKLIRHFCKNFKFFYKLKRGFA